jgi:hypothetical protein
MAILKVPSLQHLARNWHEDSSRVKSVLVRLAQNSPTFNYNPLFSAVQDMLVFGQPYDEIAEGIRRGVQREGVRDNFLEVLPLIRDHFDGISPAFVQPVGRRYYPVGRGLLVPFDPPLIYGVGGRIHFPWFSFWRKNPIAQMRLSLFVTMVDDVLIQDPDLETAKFEILDFSAPAGKKSRELMVIDARDVPRVTAEEKAEMLAVFAEGFFLAQAELAGMKDERPEDRQGDDKRDDDQPGLFD